MSTGGGPRTTLAGRLQTRLEHFYRLDPLPDVADFAVPTDADGREIVLVRESGEDVEIAVSVPEAGLSPPAGEVSLDELCQIVEGVSHFVYLADRIRHERRMTRLELELQAEVDKFVIVGFTALAHPDRNTAWRLVNRLYEGVQFLHEPHTEEGQRYRIANDLAAKFCARFASNVVPNARERFQRFHREGQEEKLRLALAA